MFKNEYTMNRKLIVEYVFKIFGTKTIIRGIFVFILGLLMYLIEGDSLGYVMLTCAIICLFTAIISPIIMIYNIENISKRINNGKIEKTSVEFDNNIKMNEGKVHLEFEYSQVSKIVQTSNFIVLKLGKQSAILVYKNGFTEGSENEFMKFIEGIEGTKLEMLFIKNSERRKGLGIQLLNYGIKNYNINELTVNEQNPNAKGFYEHLGFKVYKRTELDEQGNPYPILYMRLEN